MMRTLLAMLGVFAAAAPGAELNDLAAKAAGNHKAYLTGWRAVPVVVSTAEGELTIAVDEAAKTLLVNLDYKGLAGDAQSAALHLAQAGLNGPAVVALCGGAPAPCPKREGSVTLTVAASDIKAAAEQGLAAGDFASFLEALRNGALYAQVATSRFASGELRGQLGRGLGKGHEGGGRGNPHDGDDDDEDDDDEPGRGNGKGKDKKN